MATRVRKQVYIDAEQEALLKRLAADLGIPEAQIIRQAIDRAAHEVAVGAPDPAAWHEELEFIESLTRRGPVRGRRTWTRDDLHDRDALR